MKKYEALSDCASNEIHKALLREPDKNMILFSRKLLKINEKISLPIAFELHLIDKNPEEILGELLEFYCENSILQYEIKNNIELKRKSLSFSKPNKKIKQVNN